MIFLLNYHNLPLQIIIAMGLAIGEKVRTIVDLAIEKKAPFLLNLPLQIIIAMGLAIGEKVRTE